MENYKSSKGVKKATSYDRMLKIRHDFIRERQNDRTGEEHFFEDLGEINGVRFINNSSSVDLDSTWLALEKCSPGIIWIAGGVDKGNNYSLLTDIVNEKVDSIICLGQYNLKIYRAFQPTNVRVLVSAIHAAEAVHHAMTLAKPGYTVLFSPACASYDLYENYEERGEAFCQAVKDLRNSSNKIQS